MTRRNERIVVGVIGLICAAMSMYVGMHFLFADDGGEGVAISATDSADPAGPGAAEEGADPAVSDSTLDRSAVVVTTVVDGSSSATPSTASAAVSGATTTSAPTSSETTPTSASSSSTSSSLSASSSSSTSTTVATAPSSTSTTAEPSSSTTTSTTLAESTTTSTTVVTTPAATLTEVELQIFNLTNELRTDPDGPLRRLGPTPECVLNNDDIEFDPETGHPKPVPALELSEPVSFRMARDWSQQMADADAMSHRTGDSQNAIYKSLGINWMARGENVAWAVGYGPNAIARLFFDGWRESAGHYCNMMSSSFTHVGVGHVRTAAGKDFGTQNFYRPR